MKMDKVIDHTKILRVIEKIRESFPDAVKVYTRGSCIKFALILKEIFPQGTIMYSMDHTIFELHGHCYDITGEVKKTDEHSPLIDQGVLRILRLCRITYE